MKCITIAFLLLVLPFSRCRKESRLTGPPCLDKKINYIKTQPVWNPPAEVDEYMYKGKKVFGFSSPCCDMYYEVYDEDCRYLCAPSGGITGKGDGKCPDFHSEAVHVRQVWKDNR